MIKESNFSDIKLVLQFPRALYYDYENISFDVINYISKNISMLGLYLSYLELNKIEYKVNCRPNNKFYINKCFTHKSLGEDYPFTIIDDEGLFACRGCNRGGHIIDFVGAIYDLDSEIILKILFSFINGTYDNLSEVEKNIYNQLFYKYSLKDKYISISKEKKRILDEKINMYINRMQGDIDCSKISKKLCISIAYVRNFVENKSLNQQEAKLTKKLTP